MKKYDAILVLGVGFVKAEYNKRVKKAVELYQKGLSSKVVFSGRYWGGLKVTPRATEAGTMAKFAVSLGLPAKAVILEEKSKSTLGNFYFTKKLILEPQGFKNILVITHRQHFAKAKFCAKLVLGSKYKAIFVDDGLHNKFTSNKASARRGHLMADELEKVFAKILFGDDKAVSELMSQHPYYSKYSFKNFYGKR